jgi:hypothetical protein
MWNHVVSTYPRHSADIGRSALQTQLVALACPDAMDVGSLARLARQNKRQPRPPCMSTNHSQRKCWKSISSFFRHPPKIGFVLYVRMPRHEWKQLFSFFSYIYICFQLFSSSFFMNFPFERTWATTLKRSKTQAAFVVHSSLCESLQIPTTCT